MSLDSATGQLSLRPALDAPELLAEPVRVALTALAPEHAARCVVAEIDPADLRYVFEVNVMAPLVAAQAALPGMLQRHRGHIVNVGSVASHISSPNLGGYSSTKFALKAISDALRMELRGTGVGVTLVCPGPIATEFVVNSAGENEGRLPTRPLGAP